MGYLLFHSTPMPFPFTHRPTPTINFNATPYYHPLIFCSGKVISGPILNGRRMRYDFEIQVKQQFCGRDEVCSVKYDSKFTVCVEISLTILLLRCRFDRANPSWKYMSTPDWGKLVYFVGHMIGFHDKGTVESFKLLLS